MVLELFKNGCFHPRGKEELTVRGSKCLKDSTGPAGIGVADSSRRMGCQLLLTHSDLFPQVTSRSCPSPGIPVGTPCCS